MSNPRRLVYVTEGPGFGIAYSANPSGSEFDFTGFSDVVSRDPRIPSRHDTTVGIPCGEPIDDLKGAKIWMPHSSRKKQFGCALVPKGVSFDDGDVIYLTGVYAHAFQGLDPETECQIAGMHRYTRHKDGMLVMAAGKRPTEEKLVATLDTFFDATGLEDYGIPEELREEFERGHEKVTDALGKYPFFDQQLFIYLALISAEVGDRISTAHFIQVR